MTERKESVSKYEYNIYSIPLNRVKNFKDYLADRFFIEIRLRPELIRPDDNFAYTLMFCDKSKKDGSPWITLLSSCAIDDLLQEIKVYGAALICESITSCFVISYGNAHFYISSFCDYNFGVSIAERLIDMNSIRAQQNMAHGGKINRTFLDYISGSTIYYRGGEIPTYIRGRSINSEEWGDIVTCGTSAQFNWTEKPLEIGAKLSRIESVLLEGEKNPLPRLTRLDDDRDAEKISILFELLAKAIDDYDESEKNNKFVNIPSFILEGTKIVQNNCLQYKLTCNHKGKVYSGDLSITAIKDFVESKNLNLYSDISKIKVAIEYANDQWTDGKPLTNYIDFITEDSFCLRDGKWCTFNDSYVTQLLEDAQKVSFRNHLDDIFAFHKDSLIQFAKEKGIVSSSGKHQYETYYNEFLAINLPATCIHPQTIPVDKDVSRKYKYEICDLVQDETTMYFVKIGGPGDFAYAIDQALLTLDQIERYRGSITIPSGITIHPKNLSLLCIMDERRSLVTEWKDIESINFLVHLTEIRRRTSNLGINLNVDFVYNSL